MKNKLKSPYDKHITKLEKIIAEKTAQYDAETDKKFKEFLLGIIGEYKNMLKNYCELRDFYFENKNKATSEQFVQEM